MRIDLACLACVCVFMAGGCMGTAASAQPGAEAEAGDATSQPDGHDDHDAGAIGAHEQVGTELPEQLVAELHQQGDGQDGRLLTLAPGFIATAACSDCGAPSYLWFMAVRCADPQHCEVLTEHCEGEVSRDANTYVIEFRAVEGAAEGGAELCAGYSGAFEPL